MYMTHDDLTKVKTSSRQNKKALYIISNLLCIRIGFVRGYTRTKSKNSVLLMIHTIYIHDKIVMVLREITSAL
jgi:hypothetical protein